MNTMPTYRRGRRVFTPGEKPHGVCDRLVSFAITAFLVVGPPSIFYMKEISRHSKFMSLSEVIDMDITELGLQSQRQPRAQAGTATASLLKADSPVHGQTNTYQATTYDPQMDLRIHSSLTLSRKTEYCQWEEIRGESCQTCTRSTTSRDGETTTETYDCNCVTTFDYIKHWKPYRINSILFDQPAAHYNPQRDPMPSRKFLSKDAIVDFVGGRQENANANTNTNADTNTNTNANANANANTNKNTVIRAHLVPSMLQNGIRNAKHRTMKWVKNGIPPIPPFYARWIPDRSRYEDSNNLVHTNHYGFIYVGDGYFFSPYETSKTETLFKSFMQYVEGTLFDWQIGDLMPSCDAGDIRFRYNVQDPVDISILGQVSSSSSSSASTSSLSSSSLMDIVDIEIEPIKTSFSHGKERRGSGEAGTDTDTDIGLVHEGIHSAQDMIIAEDHDSFIKSLLFRFMMLCWSMWMTSRNDILIRLFHHHSSNNNSKGKLHVPVPTKIALTLCVWCGYVGLVWSLIWGVDFDSIILGVSSMLFGMVAHRFPPEPLILSGNANANASKKTKHD